MKRSFVLSIIIGVPAITAGVALLGGNGEIASRTTLPAATSIFDSDPVHPDDAVKGLIAAFNEHAIVAIGESHDLQEAGGYYVSLLRDKRFLSAVDDIVVEFGNARYQDVIDRFVSGESVSIEDLRHVWQDTTQIGSWDAPIYERFFRVVRAANKHLGESERVRVLLGDPPIDWSTIDSTKEWERYAQIRESFMARVVKRQVLAKNHKALFIAGLAHVTRGGGGVIDLLERSTQTSIFVVQIHLGFLNTRWEEEIEKWPSPSLAEIAGTWLGSLKKGDGEAQDQIDALLYLAPPGALHLSVPPPSVYRNDLHWQTLKDRARIVYGRFDEGMVFGPYSSLVYPEATVDFSGVEESRRYAECMRENEVESFPVPRMEFDSFVFPRASLDDAQSDPQFEKAARTCARVFGLPPVPSDPGA